MPTIFGSYASFTTSELGSPYYVSPLVEVGKPKWSEIQENILVLVSECKLIFQDTYSCLRQQAKEIGTFMLNNKDRMQCSTITNSAPLGYIMKGKSLPIADLCYLVDTCRDEVKRRNIPLLCKIYDGQWRNLVIFDRSVRPLTHVQMAKLAWDLVSKLNKEHILQELIQSARILTGDKDLLTYCPQLNLGITLYGNIEIYQTANGGL